MAELSLDKLYRMELQTQCDYALFAVDEARKYIKPDVRRFWYSLQGVLIAVANISKILWPVKKFEDRGSELRDALGIADDSPLRSRKFRNHFEHYDERIQEWFDSPRPPGFADFCIGGDDSFGGGLGKPHYMRNFNPQTTTLYFRGEHYKLEPVIAALLALRNQLEG